MAASWRYYLVAGVGGEAPSVNVWDPRSGQLATLASLDAGASVCALDADHEGGQLAAGTRSGKVLLFRKHPDGGPSGELAMTLHFSQPILALAFIDPSRLAVATREDTFWIFTEDTDGRCHFLEGDVGPIHALCLPDEGRLIGLSMQGNLLEWAVPQGACVRSFAGPTPGGRPGMVRLVPWSAANAVVYGSSAGDVVGVSMDRDELAITAAHTGAVCAIGVSSRGLHSAGLRDGTLRCWERLSQGASTEIPCPQRVTSVVPLDDGGKRLLLVDDAGDAGVFSVVDGRLERGPRLQQSACHVTIGPDVALMQRRKAEETASLMEGTISKAMVCISRGNWNEVNDLCAELESTSHGNHAAWLRAEEAKARQQPLMELRARLHFYSNYSRDNMRASASAEDLAQLLERLYCFSDAAQVYLSLVADKMRHAFLQDRAAAAQSRAERLSSAHTIVNVDENMLPVIVEAHSVLGRSFAGRWLISKNQEYEFADATVTAGDVCAALGGPSSSSASKVAVEIEPVVLFDGASEIAMDVAAVKDPSLSPPCLTILLAFHHVGGGTVIAPWLVLHAGLPCDHAVHPLLHNQRVLDALRRAAESEIGCALIQGANRQVGMAIHHLYTEKLRSQLDPI